MAKKPSRPRMPRFTLQALSRKELLRFLEAMESAPTLAADLRMLKTELENLVISKRKPKHLPTLPAQEVASV